MANLTPTPEENADVWQWDGVTPLAGGSPTAPLNRQAQALLNRIAFLRNEITATGSKFSGRNRIINPTFSVNQRSFAGGSLSAGTYGHDRWKAGSLGATYTVAGEAATITAGSLLQIIEGVNVPEGGTYTLSWEGTAQARVDGGTYSASPLTVSSKTAMANTIVEFGIGTVGKVQYEAGSSASQFERRHYGLELLLAQRYFCVLGGSVRVEGYAGSGNIATQTINLPVCMRAAPTVTSLWSSPVNISLQDVFIVSPQLVQVRIACASGPAAFFSVFNSTNTFTAEL